MEETIYHGRLDKLGCMGSKMGKIARFVKLKDL